MTHATIVAIGGTRGWDPDDALFRYIFEIAGASVPRVCYLPTATGDSAWYVAAFYQAFPATRFRPAHLQLFDRVVEDVPAFLMDHDVIVVGGGNTANMLAVWRLHGVDRALRDAWQSGVVLCGSSAGANCWFEASTTDSFLLGRADPLRDGLGFVPGSFCPHYDGEPVRRPAYLALVGEGFPDGYAADDFAAARFSGSSLAEAVASRPSASVYRVTRGHEGAIEERVATRFLEP